MTRATVPWLLILLRLVLGPLMLLCAWLGWPAWTLATGLWLGVISDIFDGIIARRLGVATDRLRRVDSQTDLCFFLCVIGSAWIVAKDALWPWWPWILLLLGAEALIYAISFARFGREPCTHAYAAKLFGLLLLGALTGVLGWGHTGVLFGVMIGAGVVCQTEGVLIALLLPSWHRDVPTAWHAWRIRRGLPIRRHGLFHS